MVFTHSEKACVEQEKTQREAPLQFTSIIGYHLPISFSLFWSHIIYNPTKTLFLLYFSRYIGMIHNKKRVAREIP